MPRIRRIRRRRRVVLVTLLVVVVALVGLLIVGRVIRQHREVIGSPVVPTATKSSTPTAEASGKPMTMNSDAYVSRMRRPRLRAANDGAGRMRR